MVGLQGAQVGQVACQGADQGEDGVGWGLGQLADVFEADARAGSGDDVDGHDGLVWVWLRDVPALLEVLVMCDEHGFTSPRRRHLSEYILIVGDASLRL
jgi:hypothetical protein